MALPFWIGTTAISIGTDDRSISFGAVTGIAVGDLMIALVETAHEPVSVTFGTGWTQLSASPVYFSAIGGNSSTAIQVFYNIYNGLNGLAGFNDPGNHTVAQGCVLRAPAGASMLAIGAQAGAVGPPYSPLAFANITAEANSLVLLAAALNVDANSTSNVGTITPGNLANATERIDQSTATANGGGLYLATGEREAGGAIGTVSAVVSSVEFATLAFAVYVEVDEVVGELDATLAFLTTTSAGEVDIEGSADSTLAPLTGTGEGRLAIVAQGGGTLGPLAIGAEGGLTIGAAFTATLNTLTAASTGWFDIVATLSATLSPLTTIAAGEVSYEGGLANIVLMPLTVAAAGILSIEGVVLGALDPLTTVTMGTGPIGGRAAPFLLPLTSMAAGHLESTGALGATLASLTGQAAGRLIIIGLSAGMLAALTLTADGGTVIVAVLPNERILDMPGELFLSRVLDTPADLFLNRIIDQE